MNERFLQLESERTQLMPRVVMQHTTQRSYGERCRQMFARLTVTTTIGLVLTSCTGDHRLSSVVVRDSAGVTIVESIEPAWGEGEGWTLSEEPAVAIGREDGPEEYSLYQVMGAFRLPDGSFVIANGGSDELRYYDSSQCNGSFPENGAPSGLFRILVRSRITKPTFTKESCHGRTFLVRHVMQG